METIPAFRNPLPSTWKNIIEQPECRSGAITTILFSCTIAWSSIFLLFAFLYLALKFGFNRIRVPVKLGASIQNTEITPPNTDASQAIPFEYTLASLDGDEDAEKLIKCIIRNICVGGDHQPDNWDGHIFREFIIQDFNLKRNSERKKIFKDGFKVEGEKNDKKVNIRWTSFLGLKNRAPSEETTREILEWKALCDEMPLRILLGKFIVYYKAKGKNPNFLKEIKSIEEKFFNLN